MHLHLHSVRVRVHLTCSTACAPGTCTVCMQVSVEFARELHAASAAAGLSFLDAPVSGGPEGAANGTLSIMAGGSEARGPNRSNRARH